ncbi:pyrroline-5-carboxylate reductase [Melioribacteraceae bacterium 4301-Me]|uniref:pyrroline-5-carboxylate reductase n=1 Tax=Pyranulibacter aquaticus TaxID=3163344 RepID=UPI0035971415
MKDSVSSAAILGGGNIGLAIANGLHNSNIFDVSKITITRRHVEQLNEYKEKGFNITSDNKLAVKNSEVIILAVQPRQLNDLLIEIKPELNPEKHLLVSVVSGASIKAIKKLVGDEIKVIRAMPNTAIAIRESMTCLAANSKTDKALEIAERIFSSVGKTIIIDEELMIPATALGACGIAFFMRAIRAASQGGIEIGFHSEEALFIAAQTAKGAATLLLDKKNHPETEVDKVTTPRGCTISGLNQMEHNGFSSALIKGIVTSAEKAAVLYKTE